MRVSNLKGGFDFTGKRSSRLLAVRANAGDGHSESQHQIAFFTWLRYTERLQPDPAIREALHWIHSIPNGAHMTKSQAAKMVAEGLTAGILDICSDYAANGFSGLRIEMKVLHKGRLSDEQSAYIAYLKRIGVRYEISFTWQQAARVVVDYFNLKTHVPICD